LDGARGSLEGSGAGSTEDVSRENELDRILDSRILYGPRDRFHVELRPDSRFAVSEEYPTCHGIVSRSNCVGDRATLCHLDSHFHL
jgi:hypothetical protein